MAGLASKGPLIMKFVSTEVTPRLGVFLSYARVELVPPTPAEIGAAFGSFSKVMQTASSGKWKQLTIKEAWVNTLVVTEILGWFWIGECIGKGSVIGYKV